MVTNWLTEAFSIQSTPNPAENASHGVYRVLATEESGSPMTIARACGNDEEGVMYIGQGKLKDRIGALLDRNCHAGTQSPFLLTFERYDLWRICLRERLYIQYRECENPGDEEKRLIYEYKKKFGDLPPGNLNTGG